MVLTVFGINHKTATLLEREPFQINRSDLGEAVLRYKQITRVDEVALIATCNRIEFYRAHRTKGRHGREVVEFYRSLGVEKPERILDFGYRHVGAGAARHFFRVVSGMDSLILGEEQIRGQVKDAYSSACAFGGAGKVLHKLFHHGFRVSKRIEKETNLRNGARSVPGAAVELLAEKSPGAKTALVIGVNETTELVLAGLQRKGIEPTIVNRSNYPAEKLAKAFHCKSGHWSQRGELATDADLIVSATGAKEYVLTPETLGERTDAKSTLIVDLAVPRDVDPAVGEFQNVELIDLQDIKHHLETIQERRCEELPAAQEIVEQQVDEFLEWLHSQQFAGGIEAVKHELHEAAEEEVKRFMPGFHKSEAKALEAFSHAMIKRFLKIARHHFEHGDVGEMLVARGDPAATETPGVDVTTIQTPPEEHEGERRTPEDDAS